MKKLLLPTIAALLCVGCTFTNLNKEPLTLNVSPKSKTPSAKFTLPSKSEEFTILLSNDENILSNGNILVAVDEQQILLCDRHRFSLYQLPSGEAVSTFNRAGKSNKEYIMISDAVASLEREEITVLSGNSNNIIYYDLQGNHLKTIKNDSICDIALHKDMIYAFNRPAGKVIGNDFGIYDSDWNYISGVDFTSRWADDDTNNSDFINYYTPEIYNDIPLVYYNDVYSHITKDGMIPYLRIEKGAYSIPSNIKNNLKRQDEWNNYIWNDWGVVAGNYFFYRYYFGDAIYSEIYSIKEDKLLYRNIVDSEDDNFGMPVTINGKEIYVWPTTYTNDNIIYTLITDYQMEDLGLNPYDTGLLKIELR